MTAQIIKSGLCRTTAKCRPAPTMFFMPGLNAQPWHDASQFEWAATLEANLDVIRAEYEALRQKEVQSDYNVRPGEHTLHGGQWDWFSFILAGQKQERFSRLCPKTTSILEGIPSLMTGIPFAYAFFSALKPGSHIASHSAPMNLRLRCHFPLYAPEGAGMRVAEESRAWQEGKCTLFDDSYDHEVWHEGVEERVVLLFDVWHPDLSTNEIMAIHTMFETTVKT